MRHEACTIRAPLYLRITAENVVARGELISDLLIEPKQIPIVDASEKAVAAKLRNAGVVVAGVDAQRQTVIGLKKHVRGIRGRARCIDHIHASVWVRVEQRQSRRNV